jgi:mRNA interferase MazF
MSGDREHPRRGEVWFADLDPVIGSEQGGHRPALIVQNDVSNEYSPVVIVSVITTHMASRSYPYDVRLALGAAGLDRPSRVMLNQIRTVDKQRLGRYVGRLTDDEMQQVDDAIRVSLGLVPL